MSATRFATSYRYVFVVACRPCATIDRQAGTVDEPLDVDSTFSAIASCGHRVRVRVVDELEP